MLYFLRTYSITSTWRVSPHPSHLRFLSFGSTGRLVRRYEQAFKNRPWHSRKPRIGLALWFTERRKGAMGGRGGGSDEFFKAAACADKLLFKRCTYTKGLTARASRTRSAINSIYSKRLFSYIPLTPWYMSYRSDLSCVYLRCVRRVNFENQVPLLRALVLYMRVRHIRCNVRAAVVNTIQVREKERNIYSERGAGEKDGTRLTHAHTAQTPALSSRSNKN